MLKVDIRTLKLNEFGLFVLINCSDLYERLSCQANAFSEGIFLVLQVQITFSIPYHTDRTSPHVFSDFFITLM